MVARGVQPMGRNTRWRLIVSVPERQLPEWREH